MNEKLSIHKSSALRWGERGTYDLLGVSEYTGELIMP